MINNPLPFQVIDYAFEKPIQQKLLSLTKLIYVYVLAFNGEHLIPIHCFVIIVKF